MLALSIRQPWAWLIVHGYKPIENRTWATTYRGNFLIHAGKSMTHAEYDEARALALYVLGESFAFPEFDSLSRGGIVGAAKVVDCIQRSDSAWFFGPYGFVLAETMEIPFVACPGKLNWFEYREIAEVKDCRRPTYPGELFEEG